MDATFCAVLDDFFAPKMDVIAPRPAPIAVPHGPKAEPAAAPDSIPDPTDAADGPVLLADVDGVGNCVPGRMVVLLGR